MEKFRYKIFINLKTDWQNAMRLEDDGVEEIKKQEVIMATLRQKVRVFIGRNRTVTSRCRARDNRAIFGGDQAKQVKTSW